jgi:site-specific DNA-adenine methylase
MPYFFYADLGKLIGLRNLQTTTKRRRKMNQFFQMLKKDHAELKEILGQLKETKESAPKKREELFQKLREELVPHMKAEETAS